MGADFELGGVVVILECAGGVAAVGVGFGGGAEVGVGGVEGVGEFSPALFLFVVYFSVFFYLWCVGEVEVGGLGLGLLVFAVGQRAELDAELGVFAGFPESVGREEVGFVECVAFVAVWGAGEAWEVEDVVFAVVFAQGGEGVYFF